MGMSPSKISRIETGNSGLQIEDVAALLGLYQVPASTRDELLIWFGGPRNAAGGPTSPACRSCGAA